MSELSTLYAVISRPSPTAEWSCELITADRPVAEEKAAALLESRWAYAQPDPAVRVMICIPA